MDSCLTFVFHRDEIIIHSNKIYSIHYKTFCWVVEQFCTRLQYVQYRNIVQQYEAERILLFYWQLDPFRQYLCYIAGKLYTILINVRRFCACSHHDCCKIGQNHFVPIYQSKSSDHVSQIDPENPSPTIPSNKLRKWLKFTDSLVISGIPGGLSKSAVPYLADRVGLLQHNSGTTEHRRWREGNRNQNPPGGWCCGIPWCLPGLALVSSRAAFTVNAFPTMASTELGFGGYCIGFANFPTKRIVLTSIG